MAHLDGAQASLTTTVDASGMPIFAIAGELDLSNVPAIEAELGQLIGGAAPPITFDFSRLEFMDSSGIAMLLRIVNASGPIAIRNAPRSVRVIIDATGLGDVLPRRTMKAEREFLNQPSSVGHARRFIMDALSDLDGDALEDAAVMVSELASNCLRHAATSFTVGVDRSREHVTVSVDDAGPGRPMMQSPPAHQPTGRGLRIIDALADSWGVDDHADHIGKRVWFTLSVHPTDQRSQARS